MTLRNARSGWATMNEASDYATGLLRGERTRLRPMVESDLQILEQWWADSAWAVFQQGAIRPRPASAMVETFQNWGRNSDAGSVGFSVSPLDDDTLLGHVVLYGATPHQRAATFAIIMGPNAAGHGLGSDASRTMINYGFQEMGLHRIALQVWAFNERALAAYHKVGFVEEGRSREVVFHAGRFHDEIQMGILDLEWFESSGGSGDA